MSDSTEWKNLTAALVAVQARLPKVGKEGRGNYGNYATLPDVHDALLPLLAANGLAWTAAPTSKDGQFVLHYALRHVSGETLEGDYPLVGNDPQKQGSAITYAKRYAICAVIGLAPDDDDDGAAASRGGTRTAKKTQQRPAPAAARADENGEVVVNLTSLMMSEIKGPERAKFIAALQDKHKVTLSRVPESKRGDVEQMIGSWGAGA